MAVMYSQGARMTRDSGVGTMGQGVLYLTEFSSFQHETMGTGSEYVNDAMVMLDMQSQGAEIAGSTRTGYENVVDDNSILNVLSQRAGDVG